MMLLWFLLPFNLSAEWTADLSAVADHFAQLTCFNTQFSFLSLQHLPCLLVFALTVILAAVGMAHFWQYSFEDKIRIRLLYGFFIAMTIATVLFMVVQQQHFDVLMRLLILCASPLIAHVLTFTSSRLSNILFFVVVALVVAITVYHLIEYV